MATIMNRKSKKHIKLQYRKTNNNNISVRCVLFKLYAGDVIMSDI
jgi:hypothetical protein